MTLTDRPPTRQAEVELPRQRDISTPRVVAGGVVVLIGVIWLLERIGTIDVSVTLVLALGTMVTGLALMILANRGPHGGLVVFGTILAMVTLVTAAAPFEGFQGGVGDRVVNIESIEDVQPDYNWALGVLTLDLREMDDLQGIVPITASVGMGELVIRVPQDIEIAVDAVVGAGEIEILGRVVDGMGIDDTYETPGFDGSAKGLSLDLQAFAGRVEVTDD